MLKRLVPLLLILTLILSGCGRVSEPESPSPVETDRAELQEESQTVTPSASEMFSDRDLQIDYNEGIQIQLNGNSIACDSEGVKISGSTVTLSREAVYILSGSLTDGMIIVDAPETAKLQLVFAGVEVTSANSAPLYIKEADKVFLTLAENTQNTLANGGTFTAIDDNNIDAAVFSKQDLTLNGAGGLAVTSPAGHGIVCKDDLVITGGSYQITSAAHGLDANDSMRMANGSLVVDAGKDGIHIENSEDTSLGFVYVAGGTLQIEAEGDGISAGATMQIDGGSFDLLTGGGSENGSKKSSDSWGNFGGGGPGGMGGGMGKPGGGGPGYRTTAATTTDDSSTSIKGLKSAGNMLINGGTFKINSADDAVHSNGSATVKGGTFTIATGDDGFHADETLSIETGTIQITESYEGLEALDIKVGGGEIKLKATDDGLNAAGGTDASGFGGRENDTFGPMGGKGGMSANSNGSILISGGTLYVNASGDGLDANGTLEIAGGHTTVVGPTQGDTATLDYDRSATISGGTFMGTGASGMAQTFSESKQGVIAVSVGSQSAGTTIILKDQSGKELINYSPELNYQVVILSCPEMKSGETYHITVGDQSGEFQAN